MAQNAILWTGFFTVKAPCDPHTHQNLPFHRYGREADEKGSQTESGDPSSLRRLFSGGRKGETCFSGVGPLGLGGICHGRLACPVPSHRCTADVLRRWVGWYWLGMDGPRVSVGRRRRRPILRKSDSVLSVT